MITLSETCFKPAWWLPGGHLQTIWPVIAPRRFIINSSLERLELPDGDFLDLTWIGQSQGPIILLLHGLNGSVNSHYIKGVLQLIETNGWRGVLMHFRGCSHEMNRLARSYHSGETGDLEYVVNQLLQREPNTPIMAIGYSLGGNVLVKWLGETGAANPLTAAMAVSIPFELTKCANFINRGFSRLYQAYLLYGLRKKLTEKLKSVAMPIEKGIIKTLNTFWQFDEHVTAPLHGFKSAEHYYQSSTIRPLLKQIQKPLLIVHAEDDPFIPSEAIPSTQELSPAIQLEVTKSGGHIGFISGEILLRPQYWLEQRIASWIIEIQK